MRVFLGMCFLIFRSLYPHGNHLLQVTLITSDCVTIGSYQESCLKYHAQFLYLVICLLLCVYDLGYPYELPRANYSQYLLSLDNEYSI